MERQKANKIIDGIKFYVVEDLVKILDLTSLTVYKYLNEGKIKSVKIGQRFYISEKNLKAYLGGDQRFFSQPDSVLIAQINSAIKQTFIVNIPYIATQVKELIISDLNKAIKENLKKADQINIKATEFETEEKTAERIRKTEKVREEFEEAKQIRYKS